MTERALSPVCTVCGGPVEGADGSGAVRCGPCFDGYLRSVDAAFLEQFAEYGARSRQVVAETCLRALVLANAGDRKLLGIQVYEQFVAAASDLIGLVTALRARAQAPLARSLLAFRLDAESAARFFADLARMSGAEYLTVLGLPPAEVAKAAAEGAPRRLTRPRWRGGSGATGPERDVRRALGQALADLRRLNEYRDLGERALVAAADHFGGGAARAGETALLAGRALGPGQVASVALDLVRGRLDIAALRVDEERLAQVVDAIDVMTRLTRNLVYAFVELHEPAAFLSGFSTQPRVRAG